jgi:hypothetical protein
LYLKKPPKKSTAINSTEESEEDGCPEPAFVVEFIM